MDMGSYIPPFIKGMFLNSPAGTATKEMFSVSVSSCASVQQGFLTGASCRIFRYRMKNTYVRKRDQNAGTVGQGWLKMIIMMMVVLITVWNAYGNGQTSMAWCLNM